MSETSIVDAAEAESQNVSAVAIRFAGDEFFLFLEGVDGEDGLDAAEKVRKSVAAKPFCTPKVPDGITLRVSVGVAAWPEDASTAGDLIEAADRALYASPRLGQNCVSRASSEGRSPEEELVSRLSGVDMVGRRAELQELTRPLQDPTASPHRFQLVVGEPGLGKSPMSSMWR